MEAQEKCMMMRFIGTVIGAFLLPLLLAETISAVENQRLIAVAAESTELTSQISKVAARAPYFLIFDGENNLLQTTQNPHMDAAGGAGPKTAALLAEKKVSYVIAGQFGNKMLNALHSSKIETVEKQGHVIDAVKEQNHEQ
jgi:predicted Fe-Mo cluster-binding NifX family protein